MRATITPSTINGQIEAVASKSFAHRLLICAALCDEKTEIICKTVSDDILATASCLNSVCASVTYSNSKFVVLPKRRLLQEEPLVLDMRESGSTYRFLLPVVCALGKRCDFLLRGRLPNRPTTALWEVLERHDITISGKGGNKLSVSGKLSGGIYTVPGNISSQYITGLLLALALLKDKSEIYIIGEPQSKSYINITLAVIKQFGIKVDIQNNKIFINGNQKYLSPKTAFVEGDWSNSALWLSAAAAGGNVTVTGLSHLSLQGDKAICGILKQFGAKVITSENRISVSKNKLHGIKVDASEIPDLVPALSIAAAGAQGETIITNAGRLRYKESDRLYSVSRTLSLLGADARVEDDTLFITGNASLTGGKVDSFNDHRIAMMAALVSVICNNNIMIDNAQSIAKSYPMFFEDFRKLGGNIKEE